MDVASGIDEARLALVRRQAATALSGMAVNFPMPQLRGIIPGLDLGDGFRREIGWRLAAGYVAVQGAAGAVGVFAAHAMFAEPILQASTKLRDGPAQAFSEAVATFGLVLTILGTLRFRPGFTPAAVGLYITAAYWFTASTSFANPAVTLARSLTDTFAGIAPTSAPPFIAAQLAGAAAAATLCGWLLRAPD